MSHSSSLTPRIAATVASILILAATGVGASEIDYAAELGPRDGCFRVVEVGTGRLLEEYGDERCRERLPPCSTLKVPFVAIAFDQGLLRAVDQRIPWDGRRHAREALNQDQTPSTYVERSVNWVSAWIVESLGAVLVERKLGALFPHAPEATLAGATEKDLVERAILLSTVEQTDLWRDLWRGELPLSATAQTLTRAALPLETLASGALLRGKTGTCCIDPGCTDGPGRQLAWFVGVYQPDAGEVAVGGPADGAVAFALSFSDLEPTRGYAGAVARDFARDFLQRLDRAGAFAPTERPDPAP